MRAGGLFHSNFLPGAHHELPRRLTCSPRTMTTPDHHRRALRAFEWMPSDFPEDIAVTMEQQVQKAVDCYNAGATVLHLHVRELDGKGSKRLSKFNELIAGVRRPRARHDHPGRRLDQRSRPRPTAPPPSGSATTPATCWPSWSPRPDQVTVTVNTVADERPRAHRLRATSKGTLAGRTRQLPGLPGNDRARAGPGWVEEHVQAPHRRRHPERLPVLQPSTASRRSSA
jgi:hypothetical protein